MFIECPNCHIQVWISKNGQCPSCRAQMPAEILNLMEEEAARNQTSSPVSLSTSTPVDVPSYPESAELPSVYRTTDPSKENTKVVRRLSWSTLSIGLFTVFLGIMVFFLPGENDASHSSRRRVRAVERLMGTQATIFLGQVMMIGGGIYLIATCQKEMVTGKDSSATSSSCDLCGKTSSDTGLGFVTVAGGPDLLTNMIRSVSPAFKRKYGTKDRFQGVFQCHTCDNCMKAPRRLFMAHMVQATLLCSSFIAALCAACTLMPLFATPTVQFKPGFEIVLAVLWGFLLFHVISIPLLQRYISAGTSRLLGSRLDPIIRQIVGIECWGWRRCVTLSRFVSEETPIIDTTQS